MKINYYSSKTCIVVLILCFYCIVQFSPAQSFSQSDKSKNEKLINASVRVRAMALKDKILLRWAVDQPVAWKQANNYGYIVERYTILRNGTTLQEAEKKILTSTPLKPLPVSQWEKVIESNDDAAVIAQGLYGEKFDVEAGESGIAQIANKSAELEQRFAFSLMSADRDYKAALMAGWGLADSSIAPNEKYLYRIYVAVPPGKPAIDTGGVYIGSMDYAPLPQPKDMHAIFGDKAVMLSWDYKLLKDIYTAYYIERSVDGKNFQKLSERPVVSLNEKDNLTPSRIFYSDSLADNSIKYYYRVVGINCFGETGSASEVVGGTGKKLPAFVPHIIGSDIAEDGKKATLQWDIADEAKEVLSHFELSRASTDKDPFKAMIEKIAADKRSIVVNELLSTNYFVITAIDKHGSRRESFSHLVQPVDSIPPAPPVGLKATIDTTGKVTLSWNANTEPDLQGYVVMNESCVMKYNLPVNCNNIIN